MVTYIEQWFSEMPSITKGLFFSYLTTAFIAQFLPSCAVYNYFILNWNSTYTFLTSFLFFGDLFTVSFIYELILFVSYSKALEYEYLSINRQKDYLFCLLCGVSIISIMSAIQPLKAYFLSQSLVFYIVYLYNNYKNPNGTTVFHPALFIDNKYMTVFLIFVNAAFEMFLWNEYFIGIGAAYVFMTLEQIGVVRTIGKYF